MRIGNRNIGLTQPAFVIAEIGVNHDGYVERALELVEAAARAGANAVKLQVFSAEKLMHRSGQFAAYQTAQCDESNPYAMLRKYELSPTDLHRVIASIREHGMVPIATPFSVSDVPTIRSLDLPVIKIASPDLVNKPLLSAVAALGKPIILSTGAATMREIDDTVQWLSDWSVTFALLHCVSSYPTPMESANLCWIGELASRFNVPVGYSDHTTESLAGAMAVSAGAYIVEKHLTYDRTAAGPDHAASAAPEQFAKYVRSIRLAEKMRGLPGKRVLDVEQDVRRVSRQSLVLCRDIPAGQAITRNSLTVQRPGHGIPAAMLELALGRAAKTPLAAGTMLRWDMLSDAA